MIWPKNKEELYKIIRTENSAEKFLINVRWEKGLACNYSNCTGELLRTKKGFRCRLCKRDYSVTSNTLFHRRKLKLSELIEIIWWIASQEHSINIKECSEMFSVHYPAIHTWVNKLRGIMMVNPNEIINSGGRAICLLESQFFKSPKNTFLNKFLLAFSIEEPMKIYIQDIPKLEYHIVNEFFNKIGNRLNWVYSRDIIDKLPSIHQSLVNPFENTHKSKLELISHSFNDWFKDNYGRNNRTENIGLILNEFSFFYNRRSMPHYEKFKELIKRSLNTNSK